MYTFFANHRIKGFSYLIVLILVAFFLFLSLTGRAVADHAEYKTITVGQGDTLWSIAREYHSVQPGLSTESFIEWVEDENGVSRNHIEINQKLVLPVKN
ncbi:cell division suppressor protein YneA [Sporolactobacillus vineae]|uniref:cell division suppressor protein YneA n=1 Tax=Sporolactobacillus vineae TaxID=444463 RepID=UPI0002899A85|nr:LysM peptidoglycan-binding domain-containing protein [Sporolactobacillus vineae]